MRIPLAPTQISQTLTNKFSRKTHNNYVHFKHLKLVKDNLDFISELFNRLFVYMRAIHPNNFQSFHFVFYFSARCNSTRQRRTYISVSAGAIEMEFVVHVIILVRVKTLKRLLTPLLTKMVWSIIPNGILLQPD